MMIANGFPECYIDEIKQDGDSERKTRTLLIDVNLSEEGMF